MEIHREDGRIPLFSKYQMSASYVSGTMQGAKDIAMNKTDKPQRYLYSSDRRQAPGNKQIHKITVDWNKG